MTDNCGFALRSPNKRKELAYGSFPMKLFRLTSSKKYCSIWWSEDGTHFVVDVPRFEQEILRSVTIPEADGFKTITFTSFIRQLNLYGFRKVSFQRQVNHRWLSLLKLPVLHICLASCSCLRYCRNFCVSGQISFANKQWVSACYTAFVQPRYIYIYNTARNHCLNIIQYKCPADMEYISLKKGFEFQHQARPEICLTVIFMISGPNAVIPTGKNCCEFFAKYICKSF